MQIKDVRPEQYTKQIRCDRCGRLAELGEVEFHEFACIDLLGGYGSIFGDGNTIQIDLCQHCLKETLGPWLRVTEPTLVPEFGGADRAIDELLAHLDPDRHGGRIP